MKKVCIVTPEFPPDTWGGLARTAHRVAAHAAGMGLSVHIAHFVIQEDNLVLLDENRRTEVIAGLTVHRLTVGKDPLSDGRSQLWDCPHNLTLQMMYQSLEMLHELEEFDLFHSFFLYPVGFVTGLLAKRIKAPHVAALVGNDIKRYIFSPEKVGVCRSGLENADRVAGLSADLIEMADALSPVRNRSRVIHNSVEIPASQWRRHFRKGQASYIIGCAGIFKYAKGLPYLFKAVGELLAEGENVILELAGVLRESEKDVYHSMIERTGIEGRVRFHDPIAHSEMPRWMMSLDCFVLPSVTEGCPNILMEAMAAGLPCVATRTGANEVLIEDAKSGLLVPWGSSQALSAALKKILAEPGDAAPMGKAARKRMGNFSARREREQWESIYREVLEF
jgi:glycosyltransferase involved in cell wall biosynthesis